MLTWRASVNSRVNHLFANSKLCTNGFVVGSKRSYSAAWYEEKLKTHPIIVKSITSAVIAATGDLFAQGIIEPAKLGRSPEGHWWDPSRTARFLFLGSILVGPTLHFWFGFLARRYPSISTATLLKRVATDQFVFAPFFVSTFVASLWTLEGRDYTLDEFSSTMPGIIVTNWSVWLPAQWINFRFVPIQFQVLASNFVALAWNSYLSYKTCKKKKDDSTS